MIKAVFLDIDGTLISIRKHVIPQSAVDALERVRRNGIKIFLCTSRARQFLTNIGPLDFDGYVCLTGAHCFGSDGRNIKCTPLHPQDIAESVAYVQRENKAYFGIGPDRLYVANPQLPDIDNVLSLGGLSLDRLECGYTAFPDFTACQDPLALAEKLGIMQVTAYFHAGAEEEEFMSRMPHSHTERWAGHFTDIVPDGVDKGVGIDVMAGHFGFQLSETMAIGDGGNDIPMIRRAAVGVAMGNASDNVKEAADFVTDDVDEDGLMKAIDRFCL